MAPNEDVYSSPIIEIVTGPDDDETIFYVHKALLLESSAFFGMALSGEYKEAKDHRIEFKKYKPWVVRCVVGWIFKGTFSKPTTEMTGQFFNEPDEPDATPDRSNLNQWRSCKLYVEILAFAATHLIDELKNYILEKLSMLSLQIPYPISSYKQANALPDTSILAFMVDHTVATISADVLHSTFAASDMPGEVVWQFCKAIDQKDEKPVSEKLCDYHNHQGDERKTCPYYISEEEQSAKKRKTRAGRK